VVALGVYPQLLLDRTERTTATKVGPAVSAAGKTHSEISVIK
jgi:hypothetical protein